MATHDQLEIVHRFLVKVGIATANSILDISSSPSVNCNIHGMNLLNIVLMDHVVPLIEHMPRSTGVGILLVTKNYQHSKELLAYNNCTTLDLIPNGVLVAHITGMMCTLSNNPTYGISYVHSSRDRDIDRRRVINMCGDTSIVYSSMVGPTSYNDKPNSMFYHRLLEPLETLGVEYIFSLFKISNELAVDPSALIYVFRSDATVNVVYL